MPMEAMTTPVWHEHRAISAELRVQMNRTQRAAQASAERAAAAAEKGRLFWSAGGTPGTSGPPSSAGFGVSPTGSRGGDASTSSAGDASTSSDDEPIALIAKTLETSSMEPKSKKQKTDDTKDDGPTREPPIKPVEQSDRELVAASLNNPLVLSYDPNRAARDASSNRARIRALQKRLKELGASDLPMARYAPVFLNMVFDPTKPKIADEFLWDALGESVKAIGKFASRIASESRDAPDFVAGHVEAKMLRDVCRHCESWTAGLERMIRDEVVTGGESAQGTHTVGDLGERRVTLGFKAVVPAAGAGGGACVVGDVVEIEPLSPLADPEAYATRLVSDERGYIFSPGGEGTGPEGDDEARAAVAIGLALRVAADEHMNGSAPKPQTVRPKEGLYGGDGFNVESMRAAADRIRTTIVATKEA